MLSTRNAAPPARLDAEAVPASIRAILARLRDEGFEAWLVGGCVRDLLRGVPVTDFDAATSARPETVLALFPRAVPIGLHHGTVMLPTDAGPFDVTTFRAGPALADDLAHRDFSVNAIAWDPASGAVADPHGGAADLASGRLRAVGQASDRFAEDPLRALRAARMVAVLGLEPEPAIEAAMIESRAALRSVARERIRHELSALVLAPDAERAIGMLRRTGIEADLLPGAAEDAGRLIAALPPDLVLRLAAWLRRTHPEGTLLRLRFAKRTVLAVVRLVALHPIDARPPRSDADVRRMLHRAGAERVEGLLRMREAELGAPLTALRERIDRVRALDAAAGSGATPVLDGAAVMALLGCGPGPRIGQALRHLGDCILENPSCNTVPTLTALLHRWVKKGDGPRCEVAVGFGDTPGRKM